MAAFVISFRRLLSIFLIGELKHEPKYVETETSARPTVLEESNHQMIKKLTQHLKHLLPLKNMQVPGGMEG